MEDRSFFSVVKTFYCGVLCVFLMFGAAMLSSYLEASFSPALPDAAYGLDYDTRDFTLPEEPLLTLWVWEKDDVGRQQYISLEPKTPVNSGPAVSWGGETWSGRDWSSAEVNPGADGLTLTAESGGIITMRWEHDGTDCGYTHSWWYSGPEDGYVNFANATRTSDHTASGTGALCVLWRGEGGQPFDTLDEKGNIVQSNRHETRTLSDELGFAGADVTQDSMSILIYIESRNLLGRLEATATVRVTMVSQWYGAGDRFQAEKANTAVDWRENSIWVEYATVQPTWTVELISYREADERM